MLVVNYSYDLGFGSYQQQVQVLHAPQPLVAVADAAVLHINRKKTGSLRSRNDKYHVLLLPVFDILTGFICLSAVHTYRTNGTKKGPTASHLSKGTNGKY